MNWRNSQEFFFALLISLNSTLLSFYPSTKSFAVLIIKRVNFNVKRFQILEYRISSNQWILIGCTFSNVFSVYFLKFFFFVRLFSVTIKVISNTHDFEDIHMHKHKTHVLGVIRKNEVVSWQFKMRSRRVITLIFQIDTRCSVTCVAYGNIYEME